MSQYRKKPIVVDAEQWFPGKEIPGVKKFKTVDCAVLSLPGRCNEYLQPGDWVVTEPDGERHAFKPDIFEATFEEAT